MVSIHSVLINEYVQSIETLKLWTVHILSEINIDGDLNCIHSLTLSLFLSHSFSFTVSPSKGAWGLLLKKNVSKAEKKESLSKLEIGCIASIIGGWALRIYCKYIMGKRYTYSIIVYK